MFQVLLPPLSPEFEAPLLSFNESIDSNFSSYLQAAALHCKREDEAELSFSHMKYPVGKEVTSIVYMVNNQIWFRALALNATLYLPLAAFLGRPTLPWTRARFR